jgi:hypothetical protein
MGTCSVTIKKRDVGIGDHVEVTADVTMSASYATSGDTLTLASLGLKTLRALLICSNAKGYNLEVNHGATEVTNPLIIAYQGDNTNAAAAPGIQVPNATSLATVTFRVIAKGDHAFA